MLFFSIYDYGNYAKYPIFSDCYATSKAFYMYHQDFSPHVKMILFPFCSLKNKDPKQHIVEGEFNIWTLILWL